LMNELTVFASLSSGVRSTKSIRHT
jgi:hypothetical protein